MEEKILKLKEQLENELSKVQDAAELESIRVAYLGKKGCITELLKGLKDLNDEEKKSFGQKVNVLKGEVSQKIDDYKNNYFHFEGLLCIKGCLKKQHFVKHRALNS